MTDVAEHPTSRWVAVEERDNPWNILSQTGGLMEAGVGGKVDHMLRAQEVLEATGLDITVEKFPVSIQVGADMVRLPKSFHTGYQIEGQDVVTFGHVSDTYEVIQPRDVFAVFDSLIDLSDGAHYTAGWNLPEKAMMGLTIRFPEIVTIDPQGADDTLTMDMLGINTFDGSSSLKGVPILTRLACTNQVPNLVRGAKRDGFVFKHSKNVQARTADAKRILISAQRYYQEYAVLAERLYQHSMSDRQFERFLEKIDPFVLTGDEGEVTKQRVLERRGEAVEAWNAPHNENVHGTRWGALNIITEYAQWGRKVNGSSRNGADATRQRAIGTMVHPDPEKWGRQALEALAVAA